MAKITILGAGAWAGGLGQTLADNGHEVCMWSPLESEVASVNTERTIAKLAQIDIHLPEKIWATTDLREAVEYAPYILVAVPSQFVRSVMEQVKALDIEAKIYISATKGIEPHTNLTMTEIVRDVLGERICGLAALTGPSHAEEVIQRKVTSVVIASKDDTLAHVVQALFNNTEYFRVYRISDIKGAELGGALKNVIAVVSGIMYGLEYGDNAKAAMMTRGLAEISRLGRLMGAQPDTFFGLTGMGDLIVTCTSMFSRNFQAGVKIAKGATLAEIERSGATVEGAKAVVSAHELASKYEVEMPIVETLYHILYEGQTAKEQLSCLLSRDMKAEND